MNLITGYFTYTHLVNVIEQTVKGKVCRIFSLPLVMLLYVATWALSMPVWAVPPVRKRTIPLPLPCPLPSPRKIPSKKCKTQTVACSERESLRAHKNKCLEKSLQWPEHHLSTAHSSSSREPLPWVARMQCASPLQQCRFCCLSTWGRERGWDGPCLTNQRLLQAWLDSHPECQPWPLPGTCWPWKVKQGLLSCAWLPGMPPLQCCSNFYLTLFTMAQ